MFEEYTYEKLLADVLNAAPEGIDTRQGSIFFDAVSAVINKIAKMYTDLDLVFSMVYITTTSGEYLDLKANEYSLTRQAATAAKYNFKYTGTQPTVGTRFFHNDSGYYFSLKQDTNNVLYLEAEIAGTERNDIQSGDIAVPVNTVIGMTSANFKSIYEYGTDAETDDSLRERMIEKVSGPAENGNRQHYKSWCESISGVGQALITPLWNGENTVKAVLISPLGLPVSSMVEAAVQEYVDPDNLGTIVSVNGKTYNVGDGLGNGVANIGAHFTAVAATAHTINIEFTGELVDGKTAAEVEAVVSDAVTGYFKGLVLDDENNDEGVVVRINAVGALLSGLAEYLVDYNSLKLNNAATNITLDSDEVPVLGEVVVNVAT